MYYCYIIPQNDGAKIHLIYNIESFGEDKMKLLTLFLIQFIFWILYIVAQART